MHPGTARPAWRVSRPRDTPDRPPLFEPAGQPIAAGQEQLGLLGADRADGHRQIRPDHRQRDQRADDLVARPRRRPRGAGPAGRAGHRDRQGGPRNPGPTALRKNDGLPADRLRPRRVSMAGPARCPEQADERRGVQRGGPARTGPLRWRGRHRDLLHRRAVSRRPGQHHRVELRRPARSRCSPTTGRSTTRTRPPMPSARPSPNCVMPQPFPLSRPARRRAPNRTGPGRHPTAR